MSSQNNSASSSSPVFLGFGDYVKTIGLVSQSLLPLSEDHAKISTTPKSRIFGKIFLALVIISTAHRISSSAEGKFSAAATNYATQVKEAVNRLWPKASKVSGAPIFSSSSLHTTVRMFLSTCRVEVSTIVEFKNTFLMDVMLLANNDLSNGVHISEVVKKITSAFKFLSHLPILVSIRFPDLSPDKVRPLSVTVANMFDKLWDASPGVHKSQAVDGFEQASRLTFPPSFSNLQEALSLMVQKHLILPRPDVIQAQVSEPEVEQVQPEINRSVSINFAAHFAEALDSDPNNSSSSSTDTTSTDLNDEEVGVEVDETEAIAKAALERINDTKSKVTIMRGSGIPTTSSSTITTEETLLQNMLNDMKGKMVGYSRIRMERRRQDTRLTAASKRKRCLESSTLMWFVIHPLELSFTWAP